MARGGARPGAGRPSRADKHAAAVEQTEAAIAAVLGDAVASLHKLAVGGWLRSEVTVVSDGKTTEKLVEVGPDREAAKYLIDRILGRTVERIEQTQVDPVGSTLDGILDDMRAEGWNV